MKDIGIIYLREDDINTFDGTKSGRFIGSPPRRFREVFTFSRKPRAFTGIHKLAQVVSKILLTETESDRFSKRLGAGILKIAGSPTGRSGSESAKRDIIIAISILEEEIKKIQTDVKLKPEEKLASLDPSVIEFDFSESRWDIRFRVVSEGGNSVLVDLSQVLESGGRP